MTAQHLRDLVAGRRVDVFGSRAFAEWHHLDVDERVGGTGPLGLIECFYRERAAFVVARWEWKRCERGPEIRVMGDRPHRDVPGLRVRNRYVTEAARQLHDTGLHGRSRSRTGVVAAAARPEERQHRNER